VIDSDFSCPSVEAKAPSCRWGDYAGASVDPINGNLVWGSSQFNGATPTGHRAQWATQNFALTIASPSDAPPTGLFTPEAITVVQGTAVNFAASASDSDGTISDYYFDFGDHTTAHGQNPSHVYTTPGSYTVTLVVTDNVGLVTTSPIRHTVTVTEAPPPPVTPPTTPVAPLAPVQPSPIFTPVPNSGFGAVLASVDQKTGAITFRESISDPGTFSWLLTFQNGKFGVFAASTSKCKKSYIRLKGKCRPSKIVYAKGSKTFVSGGVVTFTIKPSRSGLTALKDALKRKKGLPVTITLSFQSARGGIPVSQARTLTVKLKKK
jgi:hypothetical protein